MPLPVPGEQVERDGVAPWVCSIDSDIVYGPVQPRGDGRTKYARLSPELIAAGVQSRTPALEQGLLTLSCRWERYTSSETTKRPFWALPPSIQSRTGELNFPSPSAAAWLHFLGTLEQSSQQQGAQFSGHVSVESSFPSIYRSSVGAKLEESVLS